MKGSNKIELDNGLALALVAGGLLMAPSFGVLPLIAVSVGVAAAYYLADRVRF